MARVGGMHLARQTLRAVLQQPVLGGAGGAKACAVIGTRPLPCPYPRSSRSGGSATCLIPHFTFNFQTASVTCNVIHISGLMLGTGEKTTSIQGEDIGSP